MNSSMWSNVLTKLCSFNTSFMSMLGGWQKGVLNIKNRVLKLQLRVIVVAVCEAAVLFSVFLVSLFYQNLRSRFGIERYAYTETNSVCMNVCMCKNSSQTTKPICIKIIPANRAFYADCYRLLRFEIFTKYDEYCPKERAAVAQAYFANGNVLRDVIVVITVTIGVFRNNPDWPTKKTQKNPDSMKLISIRLLT